MAASDESAAAILPEQFVRTLGGGWHALAEVGPSINKAVVNNGPQIPPRSMSFRIPCGVLCQARSGQLHLVLQQALAAEAEGRGRAAAMSDARRSPSPTKRPKSRGGERERMCFS